MRLAGRSKALALVLALALATASCGGTSARRVAPRRDGPDAATYRVVLHRATSAGDVRSVVAETHRVDRQVLTRGDAVLRESETFRRVVFEARETVLEANAAGQASRRRYEIARFTLETGEGVQEVLPPGEVLSVVRGGAPTLALTRGEPPVNLEAALRLVVALGPPGMDEDTLFGIDTPQPIGASWPVRGDLIVRDLAGVEGRPVAARVEGRTTLLDVRSIDGLEHLDTRVEVEMSGIEVPSPVEGGELGSQSVRMAVRALLPVDPSRPAHASTSLLAFRTVFPVTTEEGPAALEVTSVESCTSRYARGSPP